MAKNKLPPLFCSKGAKLTLIKELEILDGLKSKCIPVGSEFRVDDVVGYGFDLVKIGEEKVELRVINSDMPKYFRLDRGSTSN